MTVDVEAKAQWSRADFLGEQPSPTPLRAGVTQRERDVQVGALLDARPVEKLCVKSVIRHVKTHTRREDGIGKDVDECSLIVMAHRAHRQAGLVAKVRLAYRERYKPLAGKGAVRCVTYLAECPRLA